MPTYYDENGEPVEIENQPLDPNVRAQIRKAEKQAEELAETKAELNAYKRETQFTKLGIPEDGVGKLFRKSYDGDLTPEAISKSALEYGIIKPTEPVVDQALQHELESLRQAQGATIGNTGAIPDPLAELRTKIDKASTVAELNALLLEADKAGIK